MTQGFCLSNWMVVLFWWGECVWSQCLRCKVWDTWGSWVILIWNLGKTLLLEIDIWGLLLVVNFYWDTHTIKFTHLKHTVPWLSAYPQSCVAITTINFITLKWNLVHLSSYHPSPFSPSLLLLLSRFSRVRLCATPCTAAYQAPPSKGFSRREYWSGLPLPSPPFIPRQQLICFLFCRCVCSRHLK